MRSVLDTPFEMSLRLLLLLAVSGRPMNTDMLALTDTVAVYGANFGIAKESLHGETSYVLSEFDARRQLIKDALKLLVTNSLAKVHKLNDGFNYTITENGRSHCAEFNSEYAEEYRATARKASDYTQDKTERELFKIMSNREMKRDGDE